MSLSFSEPEDQAIWEIAFNFAALQHVGQLRKGSIGDPYINHVVEVAELVSEALKASGIKDINMILAAVLHDVIEDSETTYEDLCNKFNKDIADLVAELTDAPSQNEAERWQNQIDHASALSVRAKIIKVADKISNLRELLFDPPADWTAEKRAAYLEWGEAVFQNVKGQSDYLDKKFTDIARSLRQSLMST